MDGRPRFARQAPRRAGISLGARDRFGDASAGRAAAVGGVVYIAAFAGEDGVDQGVGVAVGGVRSWHVSLLWFVIINKRTISGYCRKGFSSMRALQVRELAGHHAGCGLADLPLPEPGPGAVRVRVRAAAVNFPDLLMTRGGYQDRKSVV